VTTHQARSKNCRRSKTGEEAKLGSCPIIFSATSGLSANSFNLHKASDNWSMPARFT
jgi:hypothetical protein